MRGICACTGDCLRISAALATGLAAKIADELSGTRLLQIEDSHNMLDIAGKASTNVGENRQANLLLSK